MKTIIHAHAERTDINVNTFQITIDPMTHTLLNFWGMLTSGGQTPWLNGRPADIDSISDHWSKFRNIVIFRKKFRKGLNQNIDQKADIWSKPSKGRDFLRKKLKDLNLDHELFRHPRNECRNFLGEGGKWISSRGCLEASHATRSRSGGGGPFSTGYSLRPLSPGGWPCQCHPNDHTDHYTYLYDVTISVLGVSIFMHLKVYSLIN